jgi:hypothetical protein
VSRLRPSEMAEIMVRLRAEFPEEARSLQEHIEAVSAEDAMLVLIREMVESTTASTAAEASTSKMLEVLAPVMKQAVEVLDQLVQEKIRQGERGDTEATRVEAAQVRAHDLRVTRWKLIAAPIATGLMGIIAGYLTRGWAV